MQAGGVSSGVFLLVVGAFGIGAACCYYVVNAQKKLEKYPEDKKKQALFSASLCIVVALLATGAWIGARWAPGVWECRDGSRAARGAYGSDGGTRTSPPDPADTLYDNAALQLKQGNPRLAAELAEELCRSLRERRRRFPSEGAEKLSMSLRLLADARRAKGDKNGAAKADREAEALEKTTFRPDGEG